jgi:hypothetical protein
MWLRVNVAGLYRKARYFDRVGRLSMAQRTIIHLPVLVGTSMSSLNTLKLKALGVRTVKRPEYASALYGGD